MWQSTWFPTVTAHTNTFWLDTLKMRISKLSESSRPAHPEEELYKAGKSQRIMNFSLHLQRFTFRRQNKATSKGKKKKNPPIHIHKNCTRHVLVVYLNSTTVDLFWLKGVLETVHAHIHIYIAQGPRTGQMSQTTCFLPSRGVRIFLLGVVLGLRAPRVQPPQSLAAARLPSGFSVEDATVGGEDGCLHESSYQECLCCVPSYSPATWCY